MEGFLSVINFITSHYQAILAAVTGFLAGLIGICLLVPGDQPEKALQGILDFLSKFSRK